jgi:hypothetical protein
MEALQRVAERDGDTLESMREPAVAGDATKSSQ